MSYVLRPVILSGGAGTRLWPLSTPETPKQFLRLVDEPPIEQALKRLAGSSDFAEPVVVTGVDHVGLLEDAAKAVGIALHKLIVEPVGRNTGPAVLAAAIALDPDDIMVVLPADHTIRGRERFAETVVDAAGLAADGALVTFGVMPTRVDTGYGYLEKGKARGSGYDVESFTEKPDVDTAQTMVDGGRHLWNSGIFMFRAGSILEESRAIAPDLVSSVEQVVAESEEPIVTLDEAFAGVPSISLDHAVMEKTAKAVVIPIDVGWSDLGSWLSVWEVSDKDSNGNVLIGDVTVSDVTDSYIRSNGRPIAVAGLSDVIVVESETSIVVLDKASSQAVRSLASRAGLSS